MFRGRASSVFAITGRPPIHGECLCGGLRSSPAGGFFFGLVKWESSAEILIRWVLSRARSSSLRTGSTDRQRISAGYPPPPPMRKIFVFNRIGGIPRQQL